MLVPYRFPTIWRALSILPMELTQVTSDYEFLCHICAKMNELIQSNENVNNGLNLTNQDLESLTAEVEHLQSEIDKIKNGEYNDFYVGLVKEYIAEHITDDFVADKIKFIVPGITNDGHFAIYVPQNWSFLQFRTIANPHSDLYGHLCLTW